MRTLLLLVGFTLLLCSAKAQGDPGKIVHITMIPKDGVLLDKGWLFHDGDDPAYADPSYDDRTWEPINPTKDIYDIPQLWKGIGWLRLHFRMNSVINRSLVMEIQQSGASEIYLDGKLLHRLGVMSTNRDEVKALSPQHPLSLPVGKAIDHVLAVRYALQPHIHYDTFWGRENPGLSILVTTVEQGNFWYSYIAYNDKQLMFRIGVFTLLCILYLAFYLFNRTQKVNLLFSLYAFIQAILWTIFLYKQPHLEPWFRINNFLLAIQVVGFFFLITAIYSLLGQKRGWIFYSLVALGIISIPMGALFYGWGWSIFGVVFTNCVNIEITRVALLAVWNHKKGAWIIAAGGIAYLVFWIVFTLQWFNFISFYGLDTFTFAWISIPVAVSIYLGYDFSLIHRSLQQKLTEVENLSQEKQQLLTTQKEMLEKQVAERTAELKQSLETLKATQAQLIQSEKMASLGELTAGIAHEIQNPLNFVNNFSDINKELLGELRQEIQVGRTESILDIAENLETNTDKISYHGRRADAIVKSMLEHSRSSKSERQRTNLNTLIDEYLRLAYHGFRAKDKSFNTALQTYFDETIGLVNIVPQEIGRVLLNLFNNAFYAVHEQMKKLGNGYEPAVSIKTQMLQHAIEIRVQDNGMGISKSLQDKIFQPFFTTKPTGEGTGLGLSLSYDIIKAHGGALLVESEEGKGSLFIITIPTS